MKNIYEIKEFLESKVCHLNTVEENRNEVQLGLFMLLATRFIKDFSVVENKEIGLLDIIVKLPNGETASCAIKYAEPPVAFKKAADGSWEVATPVPYPYTLLPWIWKRLTGWRDEYGRKATLYWDRW